MSTPVLSSRQAVPRCAQEQRRSSSRRVRPVKRDEKLKTPKYGLMADSKRHHDPKSREPGNDVPARIPKIAVERGENQPVAQKRGMPERTPGQGRGQLEECAPEQDKQGLRGEEPPAQAEAKVPPEGRSTGPSTGRDTETAAEAEDSADAAARRRWGWSRATQSTSPPDNPRGRSTPAENSTCGSCRNISQPKWNMALSPNTQSTFVRFIGPHPKSSSVLATP